MKPAFFYDLIQILIEYKKKEFTKEDIMNCFKQFIDKGHLDKKELELLLPALYGFYSDVSGVFRNLDEREQVYKPEPKAKDFIDVFTDDAVMQKKQCAELCGKSEVFIHNHKHSFIQDKKGVNVKSFLHWLKLYDIGSYNIFKENFTK